MVAHEMRLMRSLAGMVVGGKCDITPPISTAPAYCVRWRGLRSAPPAMDPLKSTKSRWRACRIALS